MGKKMNNQIVPPPQETPCVRMSSFQFVCPMLFAWMDRNPGLGYHLAAELGFKNLEQQINTLIIKGFLSWSKKKLMYYLETVLTNVFLPLLGDGGHGRGIREGKKRAELVLTLQANRVMEVDQTLKKWLKLDDTYDRHIADVLRGVDTKKIQRVVNLRTPRWLDVSTRASSPPPIPLPPTSDQCRKIVWGGKTFKPEPKTFKKEESVDLEKTRRIRDAVAQLLSRQRKRGKNGDLELITRFKKDMNYLDQTIKHTKEKPDGKGVRVISYTKRQGLGRYIPEWPCFTMSPSRLRRFTCTEHTDVDIKNCHPVLLNQIIERSPDPTQFNTLREYVNNRQAVLEEVSRYYAGCGCDQVKTLVLRLINGGGCNKWAYDLPDKSVKQKVKHIRETKGEAPYIQRLLRETEDVRALLLRLFYGKDVDVQDTKLFSKCLQQIECVCITAAHEFFEDKLRMRVDSIVYDGIIVRSKKITDAQLRACEAYVLDKTSYSLVFVTKPFPVVDYGMLS